jgi:hypothetical protein
MSNMNNNQKENYKLTNQEAFIPIKLLDQIFRECEIEKITIDEDQSELWFHTYLGNGTVYFKNNNIYQGNLKYGIMESGKEGKSAMTFHDGTKYDGEIHNSQLTGKGSYTFPSGST